MWRKRRSAGRLAGPTSTIGQRWQLFSGTLLELAPRVARWAGWPAADWQCEGVALALHWSPWIGRRFASNCGGAQSSGARNRSKGSARVKVIDEWRASHSICRQQLSSASLASQPASQLACFLLLLLPLPRRSSRLAPSSTRAAAAPICVSRWQSNKTQCITFGGREIASNGSQRA